MTWRQLSFFPDAPRAAEPATWRKIAGDPLGGKFVTYQHPASNWRIQHCGHPTANYPYYLISPAGLHPIVSENGRAFRNLCAAKAAVACILGGVWRVSADGRVVPTQETEDETR